MVLIDKQEILNPSHAHRQNIDQNESLATNAALPNLLSIFLKKTSKRLK
jgi:hypothetical protein